MEHRRPVAIVTGGGSGIGTATCHRLADDGYAIAVWDIDSAGAGRVADELASQGQPSVALQVDVANPEEVGLSVRQTTAALGDIDVLVNCAGTQNITPLVDLSPADWKRMIDVNLSGAFFCLQAVARAMVPRRHGSIVNISSVGALRAYPNRSPYSAAKAGLLGLTISSALDLAPYGIRVNAVAPGTTDTPMTRTFGTAVVAGVERDVPLGRMGESDEIASAIAFLVSPAASFITGIVLPVDGGRSIAG